MHKFAAVLLALATPFAAHAQAVVTATGTCPGSINATFSSLTPSGPYAVLTSSDVGSFVIPAGQPCAGTRTSLSGAGLTVRATGNATPLGNAALSSPLPGAACPLPFQVLDVPTCTLSEVGTVDACVDDFCGVASWSSNALTYGYDCPARQGEELTVVCPGGGSPGSLWGTGIYTHDSSICTAAVHAGVINTVTGGLVTIVLRGGQAAYTASTQNGVTSSDWGYWDCSFSLVP